MVMPSSESERADVNVAALRAGDTCAVDDECVAIAHLIDREVREGATPSTAVTVFLPDNVPGMTVAPFCRMAIVTVPLKLVTRLPSASNAMT